MDTRQQINLAVQRTQLIELAAVRTDLLDGDQAADFRRFNLNAVFMKKKTGKIAAIARI